MKKLALVALIALAACPGPDDSEQGPGPGPRPKNLYPSSVMVVEKNAVATAAPVTTGVSSLRQALVSGSLNLVDITNEVTGETAGGYTTFALPPEVQQVAGVSFVMLIGSAAPFNQLIVDIGTSQVGRPLLLRYDARSLVPMTFDDGTYALTQSGPISWTAPDWAPGWDDILYVWNDPDQGDIYVDLDLPVEEMAELDQNLYWVALYMPRVIFDREDPMELPVRRIAFPGAPELPPAPEPPPGPSTIPVPGQPAQ